MSGPDKERLYSCAASLYLGKEVETVVDPQTLYQEKVIQTHKVNNGKFVNWCC